MTTKRERELLERCLRLEALLAGVSLPAAPTPISRVPQTRAPVTADEIALMRHLRAQHLPYAAIAARIKRSARVIALYTRDVVQS